MAASILNGQIASLKLRKTIANLVRKFTQETRRKPELAAILMGDDVASEIYVQNKIKACNALEMTSKIYKLSKDTSEAELLKLIVNLNKDVTTNGILVQLPLPPHINTKKIAEVIDPLKDVDGFHPYNLGRLLQNDPAIRPCTPSGIMELLKFYNLDLQGKNALVVGASNIVGKPMILELLNARATPTICHSQSKNLQQYVALAEVIIVATGKKNVIPTEWLNSSHIIVDVGIHRDSDNKVHGDIDFLKAKEIVKWISPVPGGVGPMTITMLLYNTLAAAKLQHN